MFVSFTGNHLFICPNGEFLCQIRDLTALEKDCADCHYGRKIISTNFEGPCSFEIVLDLSASFDCTCDTLVAKGGGIWESFNVQKDLVVIFNRQLSKENLKN